MNQYDPFEDPFSDPEELEFKALMGEIMRAKMKAQLQEKESEK